MQFYGKILFFLKTEKKIEFRMTIQVRLCEVFPGLVIPVSGKVILLRNNPYLSVVYQLKWSESSILMLCGTSHYLLGLISV